MLVSARACARCTAEHLLNLTALGVDRADAAGVCHSLPTRWNPLASLPPLPKPHHAVPYCEDNPTGAGSGCGWNEVIGMNQYLDSNDPLQLDMARITHAVPIAVSFGVHGHGPQSYSDAASYIL
jgi:hypothetical protein